MDTEKKLNSKEKLAQELQEVEWDSQGDICERLKEMIQKAKDGYYSDYDSPIATPCIQLVKDLAELGLTELANRAKGGEFGATQEEVDQWYEREGKQIALEICGGNQEIADALFGGSKEEIEAKEGIKGFDI